MKKILAILLVIVLSLSFVLAGCQPRKVDGSLTTVKSKGKLTIGVSPTLPPMVYADASGKSIGMDIELAKEVCASLGVELVIKNVDPSALEQELNAGNIDCIWSNYVITDARKANFLFSDPYMANRQVIMVSSKSKIRAKGDLHTTAAAIGLLENSKAYAEMKVAQENYVPSAPNTSGTASAAPGSSAAPTSSPDVSAAPTPSPDVSVAPTSSPEPSPTSQSSSTARQLGQNTNKGATEEQVKVDANILNKLKYYADNDAAIAALDAGEVDAIVLDETYARYHILQAGSGYRVIDDFFGSEQYGIAFRKTDISLRDAVQEILYQLTINGTIKRLSDNWFGL